MKQKREKMRLLKKGRRISANSRNSLNILTAMEETDSLSRTTVWLRAFRLHTLPLALACIALGNFLAYASGIFHPVIAVLTFVTAICLQILSNLANDYGDTRHGADNQDRTGPKRMVQSGMITTDQIKMGILVFMMLSLLCGVFLLVLSIENIGYKGAMALFVLGLLSIAAAIGYTASRKPYGYRGLGDFSVFVFFGIIGVYGSYFLQTGEWPALLLLPAISMGLLCTAVLNVNNIRDIEADEQAKKRTIPVRIGLNNAKVYHWFLLLIPIVFFTAYMSNHLSGNWQYLFMIPAILFVINGYGVSKSNKPVDINPYLKQLVISILIFTVVYGLSFVIYR
jgi:1,4-dihydroxy-2-naphthoate polyprenyltransferase